MEQQHISPPTPTLFLPDLPRELTEADLHNLFQAQEGYKSARIRQDRNGNAVGFVEFDDATTAARCKDRFQSHRPNLLNNHPLTIQFARTKEHPSSSLHADGSRRRREQGQARNHNENPFGAPGVSAAPGLSPFYPLSPPLPSMANYANPVMIPQLPADASSTLYVEGLPLDATEREVAHIFRPYPGFVSLRILPKIKESQPNPTQAPKFVTPHATTHTYHLCFVEFTNKTQATAAMVALQGYRIDVKDSKGITISYAKTDRKDKKNAAPGSAIRKLKE